MQPLRLSAVAGIAFFLASSALAAGPPSLTVHEWGTFTSLQDESGNALGGLNADDEPLPPFTHDLAPQIGGVRLGLISKGAPAGDADVTMRLETPVIYFHPNNGWTGTADVHVDFLGGWLTQFYPAALVPPDMAPLVINPQTTGWLTWSSLAIGGHGAIPKTDLPVWTAPREVDSALVTTREGESEKFLFYRGVGHLDSPLRVTRSTGNTLHIHTQFGFDSADPLPVRDLWLAEFRDGKCAFRTLDPLSGQPASASTPGSFAKSDFSEANQAALRAAMQSALVREGLFPDEAAAVLNTWELSYFKSGGTRLFFLVPRGWTDHVLPIRIPAAASITRVMVGRIELISPSQRSITSRFSTHPSLDEYQALGRFRWAILQEEQKRRPSDTLQAFLMGVGPNGPR